LIKKPSQADARLRMGREGWGDVHRAAHRLGEGKGRFKKVTYRVSTAVSGVVGGGINSGSVNVGVSGGGEVRLQTSPFWD
jgi:hypothetical protein